MLGANVGNIGVNPYRNSYTSSIQNKNNEKVSESFSDKIVGTIENSGVTESSAMKFPGDMTINYPPNLAKVSNGSVGGKSKDEMTLDEYKQWVMNEISQMPVSGWARSTYSSGAIIIKEEAFERMKIDPEYEEYVLNRVRSACSVQGIAGCSNYVGYDVIGASPEECYGYAGPAGGSSLENVSDGETWWEKRHKKIKKLLEEQIEKSQKEQLARRKQAEAEYISQVYASRQRMSNLLHKSNTGSDNIAIPPLMTTAASAYEKNVEVLSGETIKKF